MYILLKKSSADIWAAATTSKRLCETFQKSTAADKKPLPLSSYIQDFESMFAKEESNVFLEHCQWDYAIELIPGLEPKSSKMYSLSSTEQVELDTFLSKNLKTAHICFSKLFMAAFVFFIKKKDGLLWLVQDYYTLNSVTVKNQYLLPLILKLVSQLKKAKYFTKLDIQWCLTMFGSNSEMNKKLLSIPTETFLSSCGIFWHD